MLRTKVKILKIRKNFLSVESIAKNFEKLKKFSKCLGWSQNGKKFSKCWELTMYREEAEKFSKSRWPRKITSVGGRIKIWKTEKILQVLKIFKVSKWNFEKISKSSIDPEKVQVLELRSENLKNFLSFEKILKYWRGGWKFFKVPDSVQKLKIWKNFLSVNCQKRD